MHPPSPPSEHNWEDYIPQSSVIFHSFFSMILGLGVKRSEVVSRNAYIMFYVRRDLPETGVEEIYKCRKPTKKQAEEFNKLVASTTRFTSMLDKCILA